MSAFAQSARKHLANPFMSEAISEWSKTERFTDRKSVV